MRPTAAAVDSAAPERRDMAEVLPKAWREFLSGSEAETLLEYPLKKVEFRRKEAVVFPPEGMLFRAFELTAPETLKVVLLGQDPYHNDGQAEGLAFSVPHGIELPPSLRNIFKEFADDLGLDDVKDLDDEFDEIDSSNCEAYEKYGYHGILDVNPTMVFEHVLTKYLSSVYKLVFEDLF